MKEIWEFTLSEGIRKIHNQSLTATDWAESLFERIDLCEKRIHAWASLDKEGSLAKAKIIDNETLETVINGFLTVRKDLVAESLICSICSLRDASIAIYVSETGTYASG